MAMQFNIDLVDAVLVKPGNLLHDSDLRDASRVDSVELFDSPYSHTRLTLKPNRTIVKFEIGDRVFITRGDTE